MEVNGLWLEMDRMSPLLSWVCEPINNVGCGYLKECVLHVRPTACLAPLSWLLDKSKQYITLYRNIILLRCFNSNLTWKNNKVARLIRSMFIEIK